MSRELDGVLCLDKPYGPSSFAAVKAVRTTLGVKRAGHTGTLDPAASGLLVVALDQATRLIPFLETGRKRYLARVALGRATDTQDAQGNVVEEKPVPPLSRETLESVLETFRGQIEQVPPMFSALHHRGRRLYQLARQGRKVERPARMVLIHRLQLLRFGEKLLELEVVCSPGTYIRSLAVDLACKLGTVGHLADLRRLETSGFGLQGAVSPDAGREEVLRAVIPLEKVLERFERLELGQEEAERLAAGGFLKAPADVEPGRLFRVAAPLAWVLARVVRQEGGPALKPERVFSRPDR
jgi:tRNA pseudouridine55 synthase